MPLSESQADKVAKEKEKASLGMGDSPSKARKYANEVRENAKKECEKS